MRNLLFTIFLLGWVGLWSQSSQSPFPRLTQNVSPSDSPFVVMERAYQDGHYDLVAQIADAAYVEAMLAGKTREKALAKYWKGKAIVESGNLDKLVLKDLEAELETSLETLEGDKSYELIIGHLLLLQKIAHERGQKQKFKRLGKDIAQVRFEAAEAGKELPPAQPLSPLLIPKGSDASSPSQKQLEKKLDELTSTNKSLGRLLEKQEERISNLTQEQMKSELMLARQRILVDSLAFRSSFDSIALAQKDLQIAEKTAQINLQTNRIFLLLSLAAIVAILATGLYLRYLGIRKHNAVLEEKNKLIAEEKQRSEDLLLNILPAAVAEELKLRGAAIPRRYQAVSVLFADFKDFSKKIESFSPDELIAELDFCFSAFDTIIEEYGLEKIKTIGDAYMCAGGLPNPDNQHPVRMIQAARDIQEFLRDRKKDRAAKNLPFFEARIGIHTGPIIAGVVGLKKFAYDIWGDTVNIASRLESQSEPGRINVSETTYQLVRDEFPCRYRGKLPAKNVGELDMYFVE